MVRYRRNRAAGGTFFLTAALANRRSSLLTEQIAALRSAIAETRKQHPFAIDAIAVLPDHLHIMMTLPEDDADFSNRLSLIKRRFTVAVLKTDTVVKRRLTEKSRCGSVDFGNTPFAMKRTLSATSTIFISIPSNTGW
jgi:putative transposase